MVNLAHLSGVSAIIGLGFFYEYSSLLLLMGAAYLPGFQFSSKILGFVGLSQFDQSALVILLGITLLALFICLYFLISNRKQKKQQDNIHKSLVDSSRDISDQYSNIKNFVGVVSHDIKSPLNSISAISELLNLDAEQLSAQEIEKYAGNIKDLTMRIDTLVSNMMDANKIELGEVKLELKSVQPEKLITELYQNLEVLGHKKNINTNLKIAANLPNVIADPEALKRVLENLVNNAYKFSYPETTVQIKAGYLEKQKQVKISIMDQGPGFTEKDRKKVFNKFAKLSAKPTGDEKSTGLGLFIVYNLVERMNGKIELESKQGEGASFSVILKADT